MAAERQRRFLIARGDPTKMLDFIDEPFDQIAVPVDVLVVGDCLSARAARRDHGFGARIGNVSTEAIGIIALVGEQVFEGKAR